MSAKPVLRMGHPALRQIAKNVTSEEIKSEEFSQLIEDLHDTMKQEGGIGIAAPQIGVNKQVAIIELPEDSERYEEVEQTSLLIIVNPVLKSRMTIILMNRFRENNRNEYFFKI